jgi:hypothetical protein
MTPDSRPPTVEERLGRAWGAFYVAIIVLLTVVLFAKGCFPDG